MLMKLWNKTVCIMKHSWWPFSKNLSRRCKYICKNVKTWKLLQDCNQSDVTKKTRFRDRRRVQQPNLYGTSTITVRKLRLEIVLRIIWNQKYRIFWFLYISFAMYHSLRNLCWIEQMKSGSPTIYVLLISSFPVYRCHGNIDFTKN